jgi:multimeric flavodoxin WrbA
MKTRTKLLAIVGSQRKNGNSYSLAKTVLESFDAESEIVQLADKEIEFCNVCEECVEKDCVLHDDLNQILTKMKEADAIIFALPKYIFTSSKFLAFLERLDTIVHMRRHMGYGGPVKNPDYTLFSEEKPFCIFALSGTGKFKKGTLHTTADYIKALGLKLIPHDRPPSYGVRVKTSDHKGQVLRNKRGIQQCRELTQKLITSIKQ